MTTSTCSDRDLDVMLRHMRRILEPCGPTAKQDPLFLKKNAPSTDDQDQLENDARVISFTSWAHEKSTASPKKGKKKGQIPKNTAQTAEPLTGGATPNRTDSRTGLRGRCYGRGSEYHLFPQCPRQRR